MTTRIIINGREVSSPFQRALLIFSAISIIVLVTVAVIFVMLPIIGIVVTLSIGFVLIFIVASIVSFAVLVLMTIISDRYLGTSEFRIERIHRRR